MINTTVQDLLDAGVHFGHQTRRWNPRSKPYIFDHRQGISIIDLEKTHAQLVKACEFLTGVVSGGGNVLFVGTKRQAQEIIKETAAATGMPYCNNRWLGGTLTNFETVKRSIAKFKKFQAMDADGTLAKMHKKEAAVIRRDMARMTRNFEGILDLTELPAAMFVIDTKSEDIAVREAVRLAIPVVGIVDTNSDPTLLKFPIPGNDDAVKAIRVIVDAVVAAVQEGVGQREARKAASKVVTRVDVRPIGGEGATVPADAVDGVTYTLPEGMKDADFEEAEGTANAAVAAGARRVPARRPAGGVRRPGPKIAAPVVDKPAEPGPAAT